MSRREGSSIRFGRPLLVLLTTFFIVWYYRMPRNEPREPVATAPGQVLKSVAMIVDYKKDGDAKISISESKMPEALTHQKLMRECLLKNREHLPDKYVAGLLWTETELILVVVPTDKPITMDQIHAFVEIIWALEKNLGDHMRRRDVVISSEGPLKGGHGVALPLRKKEAAEKRPPA